MHFTVMVIGENLGGQLDMFYEENEEAISPEWDWWVIGGRWAGMLHLKEGIANKYGVNFSLGWSEEEKAKVDERRTDCGLKKEIDWSKIHLNKKELKKERRYWSIAIEGKSPKTTGEIEIAGDKWIDREYLKERYKTKELYAKRTTSFSCFAVLKDGEWISKNWGNEGNEEWELTFFDRFIKPLSEDERITIVDCHC